MHKVSVIIPVYNGELYLRECLDSVCAQTLKDIEIICVDDGSTDSSYDILQEYAEKDGRVSVYHQENQYLGIARNNGLEHSDGEYVAFWDCDDTFEPDALECMYNRAKEVDADICQCGILELDNKSKIKAPRARNKHRRNIVKKEWFNRETDEDSILDCVDVCVWNKLFRRAFLDRTGLRFTEHRHAEDYWFSWVSACSAERITSVDKPLVCYRRLNEASQTGSIIDKKDITIQPDVCCLIARYMKEHDIFPERSFVNRFLVRIRVELRRYASISNQLAYVSYIQNNCMEELCLQLREPVFYYTPNLEQIARLLQNGTPEEVVGYINRETASALSGKKTQLSACKEENKKLRAEITRLKNRTPRGFLRRMKSAVMQRLKKR